MQYKHLIYSILATIVKFVGWSRSKSSNLKSTPKTFKDVPHTSISEWYGNLELEQSLRSGLLELKLGAWNKLIGAPPILACNIDYHDKNLHLQKLVLTIVNAASGEDVKWVKNYHWRIHYWHERNINSSLWNFDLISPDCRQLWLSAAISHHLRKS